MEVEVWFLRSFLPLSNPFLYNTTHPPYIHHRPDYANMGSFMSSELRIFSSPRVCKEARYHHRPIVWVFSPISGQSFASLLSPVLNVAPLFLIEAGRAPEKHQEGRWGKKHILGLQFPQSQLIYYPAKVEEIQAVVMIKSAKKNNSNYLDYNR